ncbi:zeta toxin family protein [Pandoraea commovens]|uniref:Zeta toxin family protein n=1 Tax=Pandoraea commovens TaxID=2508289 RepID=A0ABY5QB39_9BURK|nr:zeta toxin family protein [Pandoraea commovens]UVA77153.1 zeta toxin family protein [Pandoraea commovens]
MELEKIRYVPLDEPDRARVQESAIESAQSAPERFIQAYVEDVRSFGGRYVSADLFKETFSDYSESPAARNRYNIPVHNTAAVLSSALFSQNLERAREEGRDTVYFLTGSPGAGKTSMVLKENELPRNAHELFEGQMSSFDTSVAKIRQVLEAGFRANIIVVHARSEDALENTLRRFYEEGRGSPIATIAKIQGGLPQSLDQLGAHFGNDLALDIIDVRDRANPVHLRGFENVSVLRSEGTNEQIQERLLAAIEHYRSTGRINDEAYRQAAGLVPRDYRAMDQQRHARYQGDERERAVAPGGREAAVLNGAHNKEHGDGRQPLHPVRITDSSKAGSQIVGKVIEVTDEHVLVQTGKSDAVRFDRSELSREVTAGQRISLEFKALERDRPNERSAHSREIQSELGDTKQITLKRTQDRG